LTLRVVKVRVSLRRELNILELTSLFTGVAKSSVCVDVQAVPHVVLVNVVDTV
jgi:hypothetical protein